jgi:hypothetical protein
MEMQQMFRETGARGGKARAANMTPKQRSSAASRAAKARWKRAKKAPASKKKP